MPPDYIPFTAKDDEDTPPCNPDTIVFVWLACGTEAPSCPRRADSFCWGKEPSCNPSTGGEIIGFKIK